MKYGNKSRNLKIDKIPTLENQYLDYFYMTYGYQNFTKTRHDIIKTYQV